MREKLNKAGVDTGAARLATLAFEALKKAKSPAVAVDGVVEAVLGDCELLTALMKASRTQLHTAVHAYLLARAHDMKGKPGGASQGVSVSPERDDRPAEPDRASQHAVVSHDENDRPVAQDVGGESQGKPVSQSGSDLPVHVREHRRHGWGAKKKPAAATKIRKGTALAYASTSIFARQFGSGTRQLGDVTRFDVIHVKRRGMLDSAIADGLLTLAWPNDETPLHKIADENQIKGIVENAYKSFDALGISHASS